MENFLEKNGFSRRQTTLDGFYERPINGNGVNLVLGIVNNEVTSCEIYHGSKQMIIFGEDKDVCDIIDEINKLYISGFDRIINHANEWVKYNYSQAQ